ncbi:MAG TPA: hypothetical protein VJB65_01635 [Patescibacteria group bacterium]|nr:hypothetical protein [Patescibacteria group bacterium]
MSKESYMPTTHFDRGNFVHDKESREIVEGKDSLEKRKQFARRLWSCVEAALTHENKGRLAQKQEHNDTLRSLRQLCGNQTVDVFSQDLPHAQSYEQQAEVSIQQEKERALRRLSERPDLDLDTFFQRETTVDKTPDHKRKTVEFFAHDSSVGEAIHLGAEIAAMLNIVIDQSPEASAIVFRNDQLRSPIMVSSETREIEAAKAINMAVEYLFSHYPSLLQDAAAEARKRVKIDEFQTNTGFNELTDDMRRHILTRMVQAFMRPGKYGLSDVPLDSDIAKRAVEKLYTEDIRRF